jgi:hypothetical protein
MDVLIIVGAFVVIIVIPCIITVAGQKLKVKNVKKYLAEEGFHIDKMNYSERNFFAIDIVNKRVFIKNKKTSKLLNNADIIDAVLTEGEHSNKKSSNKALAGGMMFGVAGAVIGSAMENRTNEVCSVMDVTITVNDVSEPNITMSLIKAETNINGIGYKTALEFGKDVVSSLLAAKNI